MTENRHMHISPEIRKGNKEVDDMINNYYWNWDEYRQILIFSRAK